MILQAFFNNSRLSLNELLDIKLDRNATELNLLTFFGDLQVSNKKLSESALNVLRLLQVSKHIISNNRQKMSLSSFPHQYRGSNASKLKVRSLGEVIRTLLIRAGVEKNRGPLKRHCCSTTLGRSTQRAATIWCHVCGWVHFKCSGLNSPADYEKSPNFRCTWCLKNTRFAPKNYDPALHALQRLYTTTNNPSAFGSRQSLRSAAATIRITGKQVDKFLSLSETYTKFRASKNNFTRLNVQSYRINEIWSGDFADVHQLARDNDGK